MQISDESCIFVPQTKPMNSNLDANASHLSKAEKDLENALRPDMFESFSGQKQVVDNLRVFVRAARDRGEPLDHTLLHGPPGLGKTTLAHVIANEMHAHIKVASGPAFEKVGDLGAILSSLEPGDVLFIDEIHRLPRIVEEALYSAMEDFVFQVVINRDVSSKAIEINLPPFTLIGATTRAGDLSSPLRARFGFTEKLNYYTNEEISEIVKRTANVFGCTIDDEAANEIAKRSRGTPRIANRLFRRVRDFANYQHKDSVSYYDALSALDALKVDSIGLDDVDIRYLRTLIERFKGGPVGLESLANAIGEEIMNLEDVYEPYLLQIGFIDRTPRGRVARDKAYKHLKISYQQSLL